VRFFHSRVATEKDDPLAEKWGDVMKRLMIVTSVLIATLGMTHSALADAAPPEPAPGDSIQTGYIDTKVQMVSENVVITVGDDRAYVKANFQLRNQGTSEESFNVRFPTGHYDGYFEIVTVENFAAFVDENPAAITTITQPMPGCAYDDPLCNIPWASWHVVFPPGQTVAVDVIYQIRPRTNKASPFGDYWYVLETGAGWYGSIGEGTVTVTLPYDVTRFNTRIEEARSPSPSYYVISGSSIIWRFRDLEPTRWDNIYIETISPPVWRDVLTAREAVRINPRSATAHLLLGRALSASIDHWGYIYISADFAVAKEMLQEYQLSLDIDPNNDQARQQLANLTSWVNDSIKFQNWRATAVANSLKTPADSTLTVTPLVTFSPTLKPDPSATVLATVEPSSQTHANELYLPIVLIVLALGVAAFFAVRWYTRRNAG